MKRHGWPLFTGLFLVSASFAQTIATPRAITWQEAESRFRANNPTLLAGQVNIDEARADEITAYLRPNPNLNLTADDLGFFSYTPFQPTANAILAGSVDYLHERKHKRELRLLGAQKATAVAISTQADLERNLLFSLRDAFVRVLLAKSVVQLAQENITYYDKEIEISRRRLEAGAMARVDFQRVELQRVQYEADLAAARVNLRTAKIDLLQFLHDRTPVDEFDVNESFDYEEPAIKLDEMKSTAIDARPDLRGAQQSLEMARVDHRLAEANGSADPTWAADIGRQPPLSFYAGVSVSIPLRIFDKNQGEKLKTQLDIGKNEKLRDASETSVLRDVESAYASLQSTLGQLRPYKERYLKEAVDVRETVSFSYLHGASSLVDFLDAQRAYRDTQLSYLNLVGAYLSAANQLNFAVGREVIR
ncbi:MAG: outer rane efflux protein [Bryobacterales bacterium]|nr:outer rane efflux protein [Bryobacterales bacterium]